MHVKASEQEMIEHDEDAFCDSIECDLPCEDAAKSTRDWSDLQTKAGKKIYLIKLRPVALEKNRWSTSRR